MKTTVVRTSRGSVSVSTPGLTEGPVAVLLHGAFRNAGFLVPLGERLGRDVVYGHLPGHAGAPRFVDYSVEAMAQAFAEVIGSSLLRDRPVTVIGESLGAVVALGIGGYNLPNLRSVVCVDPFFSTAKLWMLPALARKAEHPDLEQLLDDVFGYPDGDRIYYPLLGRLQVPARIITGDVPLFPQRPVEGVPCLMDAVDAWMIERAPRATLERLMGGHNLIDTNPEGVAGLVSPTLRTPAPG